MSEILMQLLLVVITFAVIAGLFFMPPVSLALYRFHAQRVLKSAKILVVDDDEASVLNLLSVLEDKAADVRVVDNVESMMKELKENDFDMIFVDQMMPELKGSVALSILDGTLSLKKVLPVVFFTGSEQQFELPRVSQFSILGVWGKQIPYKALREKVAALFVLTKKMES